MPTPIPLVGSVLDETNINCFGGLDGQITLTANGGTAPYQYGLANTTFTSDSVIVGLAAGAYNLVIQDANACLDTVSSTLTEPTLLDIQGFADSTACFGDANGSISVIASGGTLPYEYSFEGGPFVIDTSFLNLSAGTYQVIVRDRQGCLDSVSIQVFEPNPLEVSISNISDIACFGDSTGQITALGSGGSLPYSYRMPPGSFDVNNAFVGLPAGNYQIQIRDVNGCVAAVDTALTEPDLITGSISTENISCFGADDGQAEMQVQGGVGNFTYAWSDNGPATAVRGGLGPGAFWAEATDANGCLITFLGEIIEPDSMGFDSTDVVDVSCFGESTGEVLVSVSGGILPYTFDWSNGGTDSAQIGLPADTYFITVSDSNGCEILDTLEITEPPLLELTEFTATDAFCDWDNGELTITIVGGTPPYLYEWVDFPGLNTNELFALNGGDSIAPYQVRVVDSLGCELTDAFSVGREPAPIAAFETAPFIVDTLLLTNDPISFINQSQYALSYFWQFGDGSLSELINPSHVFSETGSFSTQLIAYDERFLCP
ncbi:MAG: PKD domain-containing protein, partial [Bacteroidota bacterium]